MSKSRRYASIVFRHSTDSDRYSAWNSLLLIASTKNTNKKELFPVSNFSNKIESFWFNFHAFVDNLSSTVFVLQEFGGELLRNIIYNIINNITSQHRDKKNLISDKDKSQEFNYEHSTLMRCHKNNEKLRKEHRRCWCMNGH